MRDRPLNGMMNERANESETGTRIENQKMIEHVNRSTSQTEYMSSKTSKDGSTSDVLNRESMRFGHACYG
jgi:hypothetical protein